MEGSIAAAGLRASGRVNRMQRLALTMLVVSGVVNYVDRATLAIGNPLIRAGPGPFGRRHGLSAVGLPVGLRFLATAGRRARRSARPARAADARPVRLVDRAGARRPRRTYGQFVAARVLLGLGEAPQFPTGARVVRDWFNARDRGLATGIFNCASTLGTAIAAPLLTAI